MEFKINNLCGEKNVKPTIQIDSFLIQIFSEILSLYNYG